MDLRRSGGVSFGHKNKKSELKYSPEIWCGTLPLVEATRNCSFSRHEGCGLAWQDGNESRNGDDSHRVTREWEGEEVCD